jgi:hypothetical protein
MKTRIIILLVFLIRVAFLFAQTEVQSPFKLPMNNIFLDVLVGDGTIKTLCPDETVLSLNYERLFYVKPKIFFTAALGLGCTTDQDFYNFYYYTDYHSLHFAVPHHITMNVGKRHSYFEFGTGGTEIIGNVGQHYYCYAIIGYRFSHFKSIGENYRIYTSIPLNGWGKDDFWYPIGISAGIVF